MSQLDLLSMLDLQVADVGEGQANDELQPPPAELLVELPAAACTPKEETEAWKQASPAERKLMDFLAETLYWAMNTPITLSTTSHPSDEEMAFLANQHKGAVEIERWARVMRFWKQRPDESDPAALREFFRQGKDLMNRITDREVCLIMSDLSTIAPLDRECYAEYMRAFAASFGLETYLQVQDQWFEPLSFERCKMLRYEQPKCRDTFPTLDEGWIDQFNKTARAEFDARRESARTRKESEYATLELEAAAAATAA